MNIKTLLTLSLLMASFNAQSAVTACPSGWTKSADGLTCIFEEKKTETPKQSSNNAKPVCISGFTYSSTSMKCEQIIIASQFTKYKDYEFTGGLRFGNNPVEQCNQGGYFSNGFCFIESDPIVNLTPNQTVFSQTNGYDRLALTVKTGNTIDSINVKVAGWGKNGQCTGRFWSPEVNFNISNGTAFNSTTSQELYSSPNWGRYGDCWYAAGSSNDRRAYVYLTGSCNDASCSIEFQMCATNHDAGASTGANVCGYRDNGDGWVYYDCWYDENAIISGIQYPNQTKTICSAHDKINVKIDKKVCSKGVFDSTVNKCIYKYLPAI
jgi:hypothetical protein